MMSKSAYLDSILAGAELISVSDNGVTFEHPVIGKIYRPCLDAPFQQHQGIEITKSWIEEIK